MFGVPPCYGADDLLLQELGNESARICNKPINPVKIDIPNMSKDSFTKHENHEEKAEHPEHSDHGEHDIGHKIREYLGYGVVASMVGGIGYAGYKIFKHFKP